MAASKSSSGRLEEEDDDDQTVDVALHVSPHRELIGGAAAEEGEADPPLFGCSPWLWHAELSIMSLGGGSEVHATLPLRPESSEGSVVRLGRRYELRVLRCVAHHARGYSNGGGKSSEDSGVVSDYPLLLLHAQVALHLREESEVDDDDDDVDDVDGSRRREAHEELGDMMAMLLN